MSNQTEESKASLNFIEAMIEEDIKVGKYNGKELTSSS